jgi:hypothetical protein
MILRIVQTLFQDTGNWASNPLLEIEFLAGSWEEDEGKKDKKKTGTSRAKTWGAELPSSLIAS